MIGFMAGQWFESTLNQNFTWSEESRRLSVILGVGTTRCDHVEREDLGTAR